MYPVCAYSRTRVRHAPALIACPNCHRADRQALQGGQVDQQKRVSANLNASELKERAQAQSRTADREAKASGIASPYSRLLSDLSGPGFLDQT